MTSASPHCPGCSGPLSSAEVTDGLVGGCTAYGGVWLDNRACQAAMEGRLSDSAVAIVRWLDTSPQMSDPAPAEGGPHSRACPGCTQLLLRTSVSVSDSRFELDVCRQHGAYFDRRELRALVNAVAMRQKALDLDLAQSRGDARERAARSMLSGMVFGAGIGAIRGSRRS